MAKISLVVGLALILVSFQNCGQTALQPADLTVNKIDESQDLALASPADRARLCTDENQYRCVQKRYGEDLQFAQSFDQYCQDVETSSGIRQFCVPVLNITYASTDTPMVDVSCFQQNIYAGPTMVLEAKGTSLEQALQRVVDQCHTLLKL